MRTGVAQQQHNDHAYKTDPNDRNGSSKHSTVTKLKERSGDKAKGAGAENHLNLADLDGSWYVPREGGNLREEDLIALASMDCRDDMETAGSGGFWGALLPLAGQSEGKLGIQEAA
jgi:hypothetical protein